MKKPTILIKKYKNRKLYNTQEGQYICLSDIVDFMQAKEKIQVITHEGNEDITQETIVQALLKCGKLNQIALNY